MKARRLPGVRCSTLKTECRSLLCLMIMPGRSWVAGIDIAGKTPQFDGGWLADAGRPHFPPDTRLESFILHALGAIGKIEARLALWLPATICPQATRMAKDSSKNG